MKILNRIKEIRHKKRLTQVQLSTATGIPQGNLSDIENGRGNPSIETLHRIATALDATISDLYGKPRELVESVSEREKKLLGYLVEHNIQTVEELKEILDKYESMRTIFAAPKKEFEIIKADVNEFDTNNPEIQHRHYHKENTVKKQK